MQAGIWNSLAHYLWLWGFGLFKIQAPGLSFYETKRYCTSFKVQDCWMNQQKCCTKHRSQSKCLGHSVHALLYSILFYWGTSHHLRTQRSIQCWHCVTKEKKRVTVCTWTDGSPVQRFLTIYGLVRQGLWAERCWTEKKCLNKHFLEDWKKRWKISCHWVHFLSIMRKDTC